MKVKWLGHSSFLITSEEGLRIIIDPYGSYEGLHYQPIDEAAEIMVVSHRHGDHTGGKVRGDPEVVNKAGLTKVRGLEFKGLATFHDGSWGRNRGTNTVFCFAVNGVSLCHLGDLGHQLAESQLAEIGTVDILLIPVGGYFTIDAKEATQVCDRLNPRVVIPMHFRNKKCTFPIAGVEEFIKEKKNVKRANTSEVEFSQKELPAATEIVILDPAM